MEARRSLLARKATQQYGTPLPPPCSVEEQDACPTDRGLDVSAAYHRHPPRTVQFNLIKLAEDRSKIGNAEHNIESDQQSD
jgi:hypothetical protein